MGISLHDHLKKARAVGTAKLRELTPEQIKARYAPQAAARRRANELYREEKARLAAEEKDKHDRDNNK
jgi:hypothetical protein